MMYDDSEGKVVLLAAVDHCDLSSLGELSRHERVRRSLVGVRSKQQQKLFRRSCSATSFGGSSGGGFGPANSAYASAFAFAATVGVSGAKTGGDSGKGRERGQRQVSGAESADHYAKVDVFPDDDFRFTIDCHLLVLAETQTGAEDLIFNFQVRGVPCCVVRWRVLCRLVLRHTGRCGSARCDEARHWDSVCMRSVCPLVRVLRLSYIKVAALFLPRRTSSRRNSTV